MCATLAVLNFDLGLCDHLSDIQAIVSYNVTNLKCCICLDLVMRPVITDQGHLIDYECLLQHFHHLNPYEPVKFAAPCPYVRDEVIRLLKLAGFEAKLPPLPPKWTKPIKSFASVLESRRRVDQSFAARIGPQTRAAEIFEQNMLRQNEAVQMEREFSPQIIFNNGTINVLHGSEEFQREQETRAPPNTPETPTPYRQGWLQQFIEGRRVGLENAVLSDPLILDEEELEIFDEVLNSL